MTTIQATKYFTEPQNWKTAGDDTQYIINSNNNGNVVVVFQGSNSDVDWKNNFKFWKKPYRGMEIKFRVHLGFLHCWKACRDQVMQEIKDLDPKTITIIGHSYGGAIATLCMEDCWFRFIHEREMNKDDSVASTSLRGKIHCITFGSPRVLGLLHYKKVKERWEGTTLINNSSDIVCAVPPFFFLYRHVTEQTHIGHIRHWWDFFRPDKWHSITGDEGYKRHLEETINGK